MNKKKNEYAHSKNWEEEEMLRFDFFLPITFNQNYFIFFNNFIGFEKSQHFIDKTL